MRELKGRYTDEEDSVIISEIRKSPHNLSVAFRATSEKIGRSYSSVSLHWYTVLRRKQGAVFMTVSGDMCTVNGKNVVVIKENTFPIRKSIWSRIKKLFNF